MVQLQVSLCLQETPQTPEPDSAVWNRNRQSSSGASGITYDAARCWSFCVRVSADKQMKRGSVPDVQLEQRKTLREQRSQNHQPLHRRAAAVQAARQTTRINDMLPLRSARSFCFSESYTIFSETLNFGTNSVRVFNVCSSQQPPDKLRRNKRSGNYRTARGTCFSDRSLVKFRIIWQITTKQEILTLSAERQLESFEDLETEML